MRKLLQIMIVSLLFVSCKTNKEIFKETNNMIKSNISTGQQAVVYKITADMVDYVPVMMNTERTKIVSYPAPSDLFYEGKLAKPTALKDGYFLDNRGITENVVFLNYTYEAYSKLKEAPAMIEMLKNIKEKYPLKELVYCGSRYQYKDEVKELNALIDAGFPNCKRVKIIPMGVNLEQ
jgi:hypothetical protein